MSDEYLIELKKTFIEDCVNKLAQVEVIILNAEKNHKIEIQKIRDIFNERLKPGIRVSIVKFSFSCN